MAWPPSTDARGAGKGPSSCSLDRLATSWERAWSPTRTKATRETRTTRERSRRSRLACPRRARVCHGRADGGARVGRARRSRHEDPRGFDSRPARATTRRRRRRFQTRRSPRSTRGGAFRRGPPRATRAPVAADLRERALRLHEEFLSDDGTFVDYAAHARRTPSASTAAHAGGGAGGFAQRVGERGKNGVFREPVQRARRHVTVARGPLVAGVCPGSSTGSRTSTGTRTTWAARRTPATTSSTKVCGPTGRGVAGRHSRFPNASRAAVRHRADPRLRRECDRTTDPRVHFALVCGAKSCPPIRLYDARNLDAQPPPPRRRSRDRETTRRPAGGGGVVVTTSKIVGSWYKWDFGGDDKERVAALAAYAGEETPLGRELARAAKTPGLAVAVATTTGTSTGRRDVRSSLARVWIKKSTHQSVISVFHPRSFSPASIATRA